MGRGSLLRHRPILLAILLPVLAVGLAIGFLANHLLAPPLLEYMRNSIDGQLRMASGMGLNVCDNLLDQILSRRLEDSQEVMAAMKRGALAEIHEVSHQFPNLVVLVLDQNGQVLFSSEHEGLGTPRLELGGIGDDILLSQAQGQSYRLHRRYFPFWRWNIISLISQESYLAPSTMAARTVYLGIFGVLLSLLLTLWLCFQRLVKRPLTNIIKATQEVSQGRFAPVPVARPDELGQVAGAFNEMVTNLEQSRRQVDSVVARLRESEEQYRLVTENSQALITIVQRGRFVFVNRMVLERTGLRSEEVIGRTALDLVHPDDREEVARRVEAGQDGKGHGDNHEFRYLDADGQERWLQMQTTQITYRGRPAVLGHAIDITAGKEAQAEQARLQERLEHAQRMEVVGTLAGGISHDFNNMLQAVSGYAQVMLLRGELKEEHRGNLHGILQACQRASELVNQLLTFGRRAQPKKKPLDLNREVIQVAGMLERTIPRMISIQTNLAPDLRPVQADPTQIEQVLLNLGNNAKDAMPQGGRLVFETCNVYLDERYSARQVGVRAGHYALVKVSDSGCGIAKEELPHIFEPFFTTKSLGQGTGLGLSTVYGIVKAHQGHITCYSQPGQGTLFKIYLPAAEGSVDLVTAATPQAVDLPGGQETVLLVDDEPALVEVAREMLQQFGYTVITASSGEEALEVCQRQGSQIDLVIMDLGMPGMGGQACLGQLCVQLPELPVIISTGYSTNGQEDEIRRAGAAGFLPKPYQMFELLSEVRRVLDRAQARA